jgi:hypothetical protein
MLRSEFAVSRLRFSCVVLVASLFMQACSLLDVRPPEEQVLSKAREYWQARLAGHWDKALSFTSDSYRAVVTTGRAYETRKLNGAAPIDGAEVVSANCSADLCDVVVKLRVKPIINRRGEGIELGSSQRWMKGDDGWRLYEKL